MEQRIRAAIRDVPDFPKPGILFKDIAPVIGDPELFAGAVELFAGRHAGEHIDKVAAIDARGFIFAGAVADRIGAGVIPIRKQGKLPYRTVAESYSLEYGTATLEVHADACSNGERVLLLDDLLATGGSALAAVNLLSRIGARIVGIDFLIELEFLGGRKRLDGHDVYASVVF